MKVIKVFEYSQLCVDDNFTQKHFEQLVIYNEKHGNKYFSVGNKRIYFKNYVGVIQSGNLVVEILPKADKKESEELKNKWHNALIYMLHICGYINIESITRASLRLQSITLIELFYKLFIDEVKTIVHQGLIRGYRYKTDNLPYLKGRLLFNRHIAENYLHKEMFYTSSQVYDHNNKFNQIIAKALQVLKLTSEGNLYHSEICNLLYSFENIDNINVDDSTFELLKYNRNSLKYKNAITLARLILQNYSPDIKNGSNNVIGLLFDMNILFEKVVFRLLKKYEEIYSGSNLKLYPQSSRMFWKGKTIRPDILGKFEHSENHTEQTFIIDTKWKIPKNNYPNDDDLKQMYTYNIHFGAISSVLLYPLSEESQQVSSAFDASEGVKTKYQNHTCSTFFIDLFNDNGAINKKAGDELMISLLKRR
ncbi:MAG: restriction endonuclease [Desulfamplus sp.]|nr:restriction endonuclease [Desulfamplus sp.]